MHMKFDNVVAGCALWAGEVYYYCIVNDLAVMMQVNELSRPRLRNATAKALEALRGAWPANTYYRNCCGRMT